MISTLLIIQLYFSAFFLSPPNVSAQRISLVTTVVRCGHGPEDMLEDGTPKHPLELAASFKSESKLDLKQYSKCRKKLKITMRISESKEEFVSHGIVMIDRGVNLLTHHTSRFGFPIAVKFYQQPLYQRYGLRFLYRVNGKMYEQVMNVENTKNYNGCSGNAIGTTQPTCGYISSGTDSKQPAGFCCHCNYPNHKKNVSRRGGHRCDAPGKTRAQLTSSHCLRPSPYWYNVYELVSPSLFQRLNFDIFRSQELKNGSLSWHRMSGSKKGIEVNSDFSMNAAGVVKLTYRPHVEGIRKSSMILDPSANRILVPLPNPYLGQTTDPEPLQGAIEDQILIVPKSLLSPNGQICDRVGTKIDAFLNQSSKCQRKQNTCLGNQPFDLWKQDEGDKKTKFRLKSYLDKDPPLIDIKDDLKSGSLYMPHRPEAASYVDIEIPGDDILILAPGYNAFVESVLTDTGIEGAKIVTQVVNKEVVEATFNVELVHCSLNISQNGAASGMKSSKKQIGPLNTHIFHLDIHTRSIKQAIKCYIVLVNEFNEYVAAREVLLVPKETCLCVHVCKCACGDQVNLACERLSDENIIATGLITAIKTPEQIEEEEKSHFTQKYKWVFHWILVFHIILIIFACCGWMQKKCRKTPKKERGVAGEKSKKELVEETDDSDSSSDDCSQTSEVTLFSKGCATNSKLLEESKVDSGLVAQTSVSAFPSTKSSTMTENVLTQRSLTRVGSSIRRDSNGSGGKVKFADYDPNDELAIVLIPDSEKNSLSGSQILASAASSSNLDIQKTNTILNSQQSIHSIRTPSETNALVKDASSQRSNTSLDGPLEQKSVTDTGTVAFKRTRSKMNQSATTPEKLSMEKSINQSHFNSQTDAGNVMSAQSLHQSRVNQASTMQQPTRSNLDINSAKAGAPEQRSQYQPNINQNMAGTVHPGQRSHHQSNVNPKVADAVGQRPQYQSNINQNQNMAGTVNTGQRTQHQPNVRQNMADARTVGQRTHWSQYQRDGNQRMAGPGPGGPRSQNHLEVNPSVTGTNALAGLRSQNQSNINPSLTGTNAMTGQRSQNQSNIIPSLTQAATSQTSMPNQSKTAKNHTSQGPQAMDSSDFCIEEDLNNNPVDSFLNYCVSASSSRTSFGTWHRKKRDQYSAYDFLPEAKQRVSNT